MVRAQVVTRLFAAALVCAGIATDGAAQRRPSESSARDVPAEAAAPRALWKDVRVEFEGNRLFTAERLRELAQECYGAGHADDEFIPGKLDYCLRTHVLGFVRRSGYLRAQLGERRAERTPWGETVTVPFEEGELYRLGRVNLEGATRFAAGHLRELLPLKAGDVADAEALGRWLGEHLKKLYADEGFLQYEYDLEPEFRLDTATGEGVADFSVTINEGKRFRLRSVSFASSADVPEDAVTVDAWEPGLRALLDNLLENAARHGGSGASVRVTLHGGDAPSLLVEDDGPGVPEADRGRIFEPFVRLGDGDDGSGLGLALVAQQARHHGATVAVDRSPSLGGARFELRFAR